MKTKHTILGIILAVMVTAAWGQPSSWKERLFPGKHEQVKVSHADYRVGENRIDSFLDNVHGWLKSGGSRGYYEAPEVSMSFFFENAEVIYERESAVENWMTVPFEEELTEEIIALENWMAAPLGETTLETGPALETWMTVPFEGYVVEELLAVEAWMSSPFNQTLAEEPIGLESWMAVPFEEELAEEPLTLESWMSAPFEITEGCDGGAWMANSRK